MIPVDSFLFFFIKGNWNEVSKIYKKMKRQKQKAKIAKTIMKSRKTLEDLHN